MSNREIMGSVVAAVFSVIIVGVLACPHLYAQETQYPFACGTQLYGYLPGAVWSRGGFIRVTAYDESTRVQVSPLGIGCPAVDSVIDSVSPMVVDIDPGAAFTIVADKPVTALVGTNGAGVCPGMSFVPSRDNEGKEFILDFPLTSPGWGLPNQHFLTLFAWEEADVIVQSVLTDTVYWSGGIGPSCYEKLLLPECRCLVASTGTLTAELLSIYDSSSFVLDADQDGCGTEFMFHVYSMGLEYGRHSYYEIHAFDDASVAVYDISDPLNPVVFDTLSLLAGDHCTRSFDLFDTVFKIESTGRISVTAGSYQTSMGGPGPEAAGDFCTSVPSLDGEGLDFMLGLHCPHPGFSGGGFWIAATEDSTTVGAGEDTFRIDRGDWTWVSQSDTGIVYSEVVSDKPVCVLTASMGGDDDFDNIMTYLPGCGGGQIGIGDGERRGEEWGNEKLFLGALPNPFASSTVIRYSTRDPNRIRIVLYDVTGRLVKVLLDEFEESGMHEVVLNGEDCQCGVYLCCLQAGGHRHTLKLVLFP